MPDLVLACYQAFLESENDQVSPQLSPDRIARQNFRFSRVSFWRGAGVLQVGARKPNAFHRRERQDTKPALSTTGQTLQKQKGKQHVYPSDILRLGQLDLWWGLGAQSMGTNPEWYSTPMPGMAAQHHDSLLRARMQLVCCGSGRLTLAQGTHICGGVSTCLCSWGQSCWTCDVVTVHLCFSMWLLHHPSAFRSVGQALWSRGTFIEIHSSSFDNTSGVSTGIIMSEVGTGDVSWTQ